MNKGRGRAERKTGLGEGLLGRLIPFTLLHGHIHKQSVIHFSTVLRWSTYVCMMHSKIVKYWPFLCTVHECEQCCVYVNGCSVCVFRAVCLSSLKSFTISAWFDEYAPVFVCVYIDRWESESEGGFDLSVLNILCYLRPCSVRSVFKNDISAGHLFVFFIRVHYHS